MSATTEMVTIDRELLYSLLVEAQGVIETFETLTGSTPAHCVERLEHVALEVGQAAGITPSDDELLAWGEVDNDAHPALLKLWAAGERRCEEILGLTQKAASS